MKRNVKRSEGGRQAIVRSYNRRRWYQLADWLADFVVNNAGWVVVAVVVLLLPVAILALVLGAHSLPLEYLGIPALDSLTIGGSNFSSSALTLLIEYILLILAIRPLFQQRKLGWKLVMLAALVHLIDSLVLQHAVSGAVELVVVAYLYFQVREQLT
jgi:hypothetical protein